MTDQSPDLILLKDFVYVDGEWNEAPLPKVRWEAINEPTAWPPLEGDDA